MPLLDRPGGKVFWTTTGCGTPLLLIQGLGYSSDANFRIVPGLAERHTVIELDNRGVGRSDVSTEQLTIELMAADAAAVVEEAGLGPAHVAGFSMGGLIAQELALSRPEIVRTLVLGCTSPGGSAAVLLSPDTARRLAEISTLPALEAAQQSAAIVYANSSEAQIADDIRARMVRPTGRVAYMAQLTAAGRYRGTADRLHGLDKPVLVVQGSQDRLVPPANADVLLAAIPGAELHVFEGAGHILMTDATDPLIQTMLGFLARHDGPPSGPAG